MSLHDGIDAAQQFRHPSRQVLELMRILYNQLENLRGFICFKSLVFEQMPVYDSVIKEGPCTQLLFHYGSFWMQKSADRRW